MESKTEVERRVAEVFRLRIGGAEFSDIVEFAASQTPPWGVSERQLFRYIHRADRLCKERFDSKADHLLARHLLQRRRLYAHAMEAGDFKTALAVLQDEAKLEGLYPPARTDTRLSGPGGGPVEVATNDRLAIFRKRYAAVHPGADDVPQPVHPPLADHAAAEIPGTGMP